MWYCSVPSSRPQRYLSPIPLKSCPRRERNSKSYFKKPGWDSHLRDSGGVRSNDHIDTVLLMLDRKQQLSHRESLLSVSDVPLSHLQALGGRMPKPHASFIILIP